jgi:hypothetical protein
LRTGTATSLNAEKAQALLPLRDSAKPSGFTSLNNNHQKNANTFLDIVHCLRLFKHDVSESGLVSSTACKVSSTVGTNRDHDMAHDISRRALVAEGYTYCQAFHVELKVDKFAMALGLLRSVFLLFLEYNFSNDPYSFTERLPTETDRLVKAHVKSDLLLSPWCCIL